MNTIGKNEELFNYLSIKKLYILDSLLSKTEIYESQFITCVDLHFKLIRNNYLLKIKCSNVIEYSFYYRIHKPIYVERYKFFKKDDLFYLCLDPYNEGEEINENDQDFILCKEVEGYV